MSIPMAGFSDVPMGLPPSPVVLQEIQLCPVFLFEDFHDGLKVVPYLQFNFFELLLAKLLLDLLKNVVKVHHLICILKCNRG